ncbi:MAG: succinylglutamate desuccinylase/aspartoacylase family protein [Gammaproteobacteria bacterium]|nr:succinylglutamate desuccinylase/aspartoacylase family protein [Gammaproteobacteria bacterium]
MVTLQEKRDQPNGWNRGVVMLLLGVWLLPVVAQKLEFTLHKNRGEQPGPTLLVIGGIQGDEPGGFNAAALLVTNYHITRGQVWVVPNLNFESIIQRSRGVYGDMNRKFLSLKQADPEYGPIQKIKSIILDPQVDMILNLHDGGGFYVPTYRDRNANPDHWGQSVIIDQASVDNIAYGNLQEIATTSITQANQQITPSDHHYHLRNTQTRLGNQEMEKTLSYFAVRNGKSAFGIEASKEFLTHERVRFHLLLVEGFMRQLGIGFSRDFDLTPQSIRQRIDNNVQLALFGRRIFFDMANARKLLSFVPLKKDVPLDIQPSNPLIAVIDKEKNLDVRYGNRYVTQLRTYFTEYDDSLNEVNIVKDGQPITSKLGSVIEVQDSFRVEASPGYRVNVIGYQRAANNDDGHVTLRRRDLLPQYSVDKQARLYRVEIYRAARFCGMLLVRFANSPAGVAPPFTQNTTNTNNT